MALSDKIEAFICELLKNEQEEWLIIGRNELASIFGCVPSQINYVISTRFSNDSGYIVESRRGGGGYMRIKRVNPVYMDIASSLPTFIDCAGAFDILDFISSKNLISTDEYKIISSVISEKMINNTQRAQLLKNMISAKTI